MKIRFPWERRKDDLQEELQSHLRMAVEDRVARGYAPEQARLDALREMGNLPLVADVTRRQWGGVWLERALQDARYALRQLRKSPGYTITALLTLILTIGANTAIFGLLYAVLLRSLPVSHPERMVQFQLQLATPTHTEEPSSQVSDSLYDLLAASQRSSSGLCGWQELKMSLHAPEGTQPVAAAALTGGCTAMLGLRPALGRLLQDADTRPGGSPEGYAVVLGYDYWRTRFNADPAVLGRAMDFGAGFRVGARHGVVVGVMQKGFDDVTVGSRPELFVPLEMVDPAAQHNFSSFDTIVMGRLKDGVEPRTAQAEADTIFQAKLRSDKKIRYYTVVDGRFTEAGTAHVMVEPARTGFSYLRSEYKRPLYLIEGMVGLSLLVACAYLSMLASARALSRRRELAVRMALGASRARVAAQLTWESVLLVAAGSGLGVLFAWGAERTLTMLIGTLSRDALELNAGPGGMVMLFTLGLMALVVIVSGLWPAWRASRVDPVTDMKEGDASIVGRRAPRMGRWLVPAQIAFSLVIVMMAALMGSTVARLVAVDPGFRTSGITFLETDFSSRVEETGKNKVPRIPVALLLSLLDRIRQTPGVEGVSITQAYPLEGSMYLTSISAQPLKSAVRTDESITSLAVTPGYFSTMSVPLVSGRDFSIEDRQQAAEVCILSRSAAEYLFPGEDAVGRPVTIGETRARVIGVASDTLYSDLRHKAPRMLYQPYLGTYWNPFAAFIVRAHDTGTAVNAVRGAFHDLAPDVPVNKPVTMEQLVRRTMGREQMVALLAGFFALLTLALTGIGLYGVMNYGVVRRSMEIGVRMALGSTPGGVMRMILREALWLVLPGLVLGGAGVWGVTRLLKTLLYGVKPLDPWICATSLLVLAAVALCASMMPARRAAAVHPSEALRSE